MVARWRFVHAQASWPAAVLRLDCAVSVSQTRRACVQKLARRRTLAAQLLPDLRIIPGHGSTGRYRSGTPSTPVMRLLPYALALPAHRCAFCETAEDHRLEVLAVEGEYGLRIDYCEDCGGYLKTYNGEGSEDLLLKDWTSLHLDVVARDRGLKRLGMSLYEL